jgi:hypothetical protein
MLDDVQELSDCILSVQVVPSPDKFHYDFNYPDNVYYAQVNRLQMRTCIVVLTTIELCCQTVLETFFVIRLHCRKIAAMLLQRVPVLHTVNRTRTASLDCYLWI